MVGERFEVGGCDAGGGLGHLGEVLGLVLLVLLVSLWWCVGGVWSGRRVFEQARKVPAALGRARRELYDDWATSSYPSLGSMQVVPRTT